MNNLVIGNTSQLAFYFPEDYEKISSRDFNFLNYENSFYNRIYLTFAEQRTYLKDEYVSLFNEINIEYTLKFIDFFNKRCNYLIIYGTCELWNNCEGPIEINDSINFNYTPYILSKYLMVQNIKNLIKKNIIKNVIVIHPFNFNSPYRKDGFLFSKIFDSIINKKKIEIGDTYFYRDLIHPKYVVQKSIIAKENMIIGSGRLTFVNDFIRDLYLYSGASYNELVKENFDHNLKNKRRIFYKKNSKIDYNYNKLIGDTLYDIRQFKNKIS